MIKYPAEHNSEAEIEYHMSMMETFTMFGEYVPGHIRGGIARYLAEGREPGDFLTAVICDNLHKALSHADSSSYQGLRAIVGYFYNHAPSGAWGSEKAMKEWCEEMRRKMNSEAEEKEDETSY